MGVAHPQRGNGYLKKQFELLHHHDAEQNAVSVRDSRCESASEEMLQCVID